MKTLLLALAVVAFVCWDSADQLGLGRQRIDRGQHQAKVSYGYHCFECNRNTSWHCSTPKRCKWGQNKCYNVYNSDGEWIVKGCAFTCPTAEPDERVKCCFTENCNKY